MDFNVNITNREKFLRMLSAYSRINEFSLGIVVCTESATNDGAIIATVGDKVLDHLTAGQLEKLRSYA